MKNVLLIFCVLICCCLAAQPANDLCAGAQVITPNGACVAGTTVAATDNWTSIVGCQFGSPNNHPDVWYSFVATGTNYTGTVTTSSPWVGNVEFTLVSGTCASSFAVVGSACGASPLSVNIGGLTNGTTYYFTISNVPTGTKGPFSVCSTTSTPSCTGLTCSTPNVVTYTTGVQTCLTGCNTGAGPGPDFTGNNCYDFPNATTWYQITTGASSASIDFNLTSSTLNSPYFTVFTTTNCSTYTTINCTQGSAGSATGTVYITANTTYLVAVSDGAGAQGNFNFCVTVNNDNSACNTNNQLSVSSTSMGSPLTGPFQPGEVVTFCYSVTNYTQYNCNYMEGFVPTFGDCWDPVSFDAQGKPVNITVPLTTAGVIQAVVPNPGTNACAGTPSGTWSWFPAGSVLYNNINNPSIPNGTSLGAGWFFLSSYSPATGLCVGDPTDPDNSYGDSDYPSCGNNTLDWQVCFQLQARAIIACTNGQTDCSVAMKTYADGEVGYWNNVGCTSDLPAVFPATLCCLAAPTGTGATICAGNTATISATGSATGILNWYAASTGGSSLGTGTSFTTPVLNSNTTYYVACTDGGCTSPRTAVTVTVNAKPTAAPTATPAVICNGGSTTLAANATAGSGSISTYAWSSGLGNVASGSVSPTTNTTYTVTVTNSNSCSVTASVLVTVKASPTVAPTATPTTICNGQSTTLAANAAAGSGSISTYAWSSGLGNVAGGSVSPTTNTTYTVTVTNSNTCTATGTVSVTVNAVPTVAPTATLSIICNGQSTTLAANAAAGSGSISTYAWSSGLGNVAGGSVSPTTNTTYTVTVTNSNTCTVTGSVTVTVNAKPTVAPTATPIAICNGQNTTLAANATAGSGSISTYAWSSGLGNVAGGNVSPTTNTTYTVTVTNSNTCTVTGTVSVTVNAIPTVAPTATLSTICNGQSTTLAANAAAGSGSISTYVWSSGLGNVAGGSVSPTTNTTYTVTVTNSNTCTATGTVSVTVNAVPTAAPTATPSSICNGQSTTLAANATAGSGSISTYAWSTGLGNVASGSVTPTVNTIYVVTVTNSNLCSATGTVLVTVYGNPTVAPTATPTSICNGQTTTLAANATAGSGSISTYAWSSGLGNVAGGSVSPTTNIIYTVTVTNSNTCTATGTVSVTVNSMPTAAPTAIPSTICNGQSTTLAANATAGSGSISTYAWSSGLGNVATGSVSPTTNTTYTVTVTNSNSCTVTGAVSVTVNAVPTVAPTATPATICNGGSTTLVANAIAGSGSISTYAWSSGLGNVAGGSVSPTTNTAYTVTVTNSNTCTVTGTVSVTVNSLPSPTATNTGPYCAGSTIQLHAGGGNSYSWSGPSAFTSNSQSPTRANATIAMAGTYTVTVTDANGCSATISTNVVINSSLVPIASNTGPYCAGSIIQLNVIGGNTYSWSGPNSFTDATQSPNINNATTLMSGTYNVTATDLNGCSGTASTVVTVNLNPTIAPTATPIAICNGQSTTLAANATAGSGSISAYTWSSGLGNAAGGSVSPTTNTIYTVTVTNSNTCTATGTVSVTVNALPTAAPTATPAVICNGGSTTLAANAAAGSGSISTYAWSSGLGNVAGGSVSPTTNTIYTVTVTNSNTCTATGTVSVTVNAVPTVAPTATPATICNGGSTTLATNAAAGSGSISTYAWSSDLGNVAGGSVSPTTNTTYTVTVTNSNTCTVTGTVSVTVNSLPSPIATNTGPYCAASTIQLSSGGGTSYAWSGPNAFASNAQNPGLTNATIAMGGTYIVTVTDGNGCSATTSTTVAINSSLVPVASNTGPYCEGENVQLNVIGGNTYSWSGPNSFTDASQNPTINNGTTLMSGTYDVTATDLNGCSGTASTSVIVNALPTVASTATPAVICNGGSATLAANATAGSGSITTYAWSSGLGNVPGGSVSPTTSTSYTVTVTNNNSCTVIGTVSVTVNAVPTVAPTATPTIICNGGNTTLAANAAAGSGSILSYTWSTGLGNLAGGSVFPTINTIYTVTVTNSNACTASASVSVTVNQVPSSIAGNTGPFCVGSTIQLNSSVGNAYSWSGPNAYSSAAQNPSIANSTVAMNGAYSVMVTDANGCTTTASTVVVVNALPVPSASNTGPYCTGSTIQLNSSGGTSYTWSGPNAYSGSVQNPAIVNSITSNSGVYIVTSTDANGCSSTASTNVVVSSSLSPLASNTGAYCAGSTIQLNVIGGNTYSWSGPNAFASAFQNPTLSNSTTLMSGTYNVTASDLNGCSGTASTTVVVNTLPVPLASNTGPYCAGAIIQLNSSGGISYVWSGPNSYSSQLQNPSIANSTTLMGGTYSVTVTDVNSCSATASSVVAVNSLPVADAGPDAVITCLIPQPSLNAPAIAVSESYLWSGTGIVSGGNTATPTVNANGIYTLLLTDANGCTATDNANVTSDVAVPNANAGTDATLTCSVTSVTLLASSTTAGVSFAWSNGINVASNAVSVANTYTVTVTNPANGCTASDNTVITSNATSPNANGGPDGILTCVATSITLTASSVTAGVNFAWNNGVNTANNTVSLANTYTVTVTDPTNGCTASDVVDVLSNTTAPNVNAGADQTLSCSTTSVQLNGSSVTAGVTYSWSGAGILNGGNTAMPNVNVTGTYTLLVTDPVNGCTANDAADVLPDVNAPNANAGPDATLTCNITSVTLTASSTTAGVTFAWSNGTGTANNTVSTANVYTVTVTDPGNGCTSSDQATVNSNLIVPNANAGPDALLTCAIGSVTLTASSTTAAASFVWSTGDNTSATVASAVNTYTVTVTDATNGCTASDDADVTLDSAVPNVNAGPDKILSCLMNGVTLNGSSTTSNAVYNWSGTGIVSGANTVSPLVNLVGTYTLVVTDPSNGCTASDAADVADPNAIVLTADVTDNPCAQVSIGQIDLHVSGGTTPYVYLWSNNAISEDISNLRGGAYSITVTDNNGCTASDIYQLNEGVFTVNAQQSTTINLGEVVQLTGMTTGGTGQETYVWSPEYHLSCVDCISTVASPYTDMVYVLQVTDVTGCKGYDTVAIHVLPLHDIFIPNVFTPNGDGNNDMFSIYGKLNLLTFFNVKIFNRWGEKVFESDNANFAWDGTFKSVMQNPQVFTYTIKTVFIDGFSRNDFKGTLTLVK